MASRFASSRAASRLADPVPPPKKDSSPVPRCWDACNDNSRFSIPSRPELRLTDTMTMRYYAYMQLVNWSRGREGGGTLDFFGELPKP